MAAAAPNPPTPAQACAHGGPTPERRQPAPGGSSPAPATSLARRPTRQCPRVCVRILTCRLPGRRLLLPVVVVSRRGTAARFSLKLVVSKSGARSPEAAWRGVVYMVSWNDHFVLKVESNCY
jgi:hypothetical protein